MWTIISETTCVLNVNIDFSLYVKKNINRNVLQNICVDRGHQPPLLCYGEGGARVIRFLGEKTISGGRAVDNAQLRARSGVSREKSSWLPFSGEEDE